jgi:hydroxymethylglutaryl-CoA reductase (NADPH)
MKTIGPIKMIGTELNDEVSVPLATYETPLWPSVNRGARVSRLTAGIDVTVIDERMTRSVLVEAPNAAYALSVAEKLPSSQPEMQSVVATTSRFAKLKDCHSQIVGNLLYIRFEFFTGDASGHNMVTKAADALMSWLLETFSQLQYVSVSGNFCTDKKPSAVNGILGRGKNVVAEILIPRDICEKHLRTTPEAIVNLNIKKNLIGTMLAGGLRSANAHFANMLLAIYLATGQDAANIVEGSQGFVHCEVKNHDLYFSVTLPNVIVGSVGNGKHLDFVQENLRMLGCMENREPGKNSRRLAAIVAATVLCGELSLLAAQTNPGELMRSHITLERQHSRQEGGSHG